MKKIFFSILIIVLVIFIGNLTGIQAVDDTWTSGKTLYLSDLPRELITTPNEPPYENCVPHFDENERAIKMVVKGVPFDKGIWYHASQTYDNSVILFDISKYDFTSFTVNVGIDDYINGIGTCEFIIYGDGELLAQSPVISQGQENYKMQVNVSGVKELQFVQTNGDDGYSFDWGVWGNPLLGYDVMATPVPTEAPTLRPTTQQTTQPTTPITTNSKTNSTTSNKTTSLVIGAKGGNKISTVAIVLVAAAVVIIGAVTVVILKSKKKQ